MNFHSLRSTWVASVLGFITAVLLASCGGGGAAQTTTGGVVQLLGSGSAYGGVPYTMQILGGRPPYNLQSSEPGVFPVPTSTTSSIVVVLPANPGVVDAGLPPDALPIRTATVTVRDSNGGIATASVRVGINFLTSYGFSFFSSSCPATGSGGTSAGLVCAGGDSTMAMQAVFNGNLYGGREFRIDVLQGNFTLVNPDTGASGQSIGVTSDHQGNVTAVVRVPANTPTQLAAIRVTDVASGTHVVETFTISGAATNGELTTIPDTLSFVGPDSATCGTGTGDFFVFDGVPPYVAISSDQNVQVTYIDPYHNPGRFRVTVGNSSTCVTNGQVVVTDSLNNRGVVTVTSSKGSAAPPTPVIPLSVQPGTLTLGCGQSASVSAVGGASTSSGGSGGSSVTYSVSSANPNVTATVSGNTVTITRAGPTGAGTGTTTSTVNVTDGSTVVGVQVTAPTTCP